MWKYPIPKFGERLIIQRQRKEDTMSKEAPGGSVLESLYFKAYIPIILTHALKNENVAKNELERNHMFFFSKQTTLGKLVPASIQFGPAHEFFKYC